MCVMWLSSWRVLFFPSPLSVPLGRRSTHWFCTKADKASVIRWPRRMSQIEEKLFPEQIMMSPVKAPACLYPHVEVLQGTKRSVKESSNKSKKSSPQMGSLHPESARQHFRRFCYHDTPGPYEAVSQLQELCSQWLRPEIHSKEQILELLVLEQFLDVLPSHIQNWVQKYHPQNVKEAVALVDRFHRECGGLSNEVSRKILTCTLWKRVKVGSIIGEWDGLSHSSVVPLE